MPGLFRTSEGPIFHTGDFKIDYTPVGPHAEYEKLAIYQEFTLSIMLTRLQNCQTNRIALP